MERGRGLTRSSPLLPTNSVWGAMTGEVYGPGLLGVIREVVPEVPAGGRNIVNTMVLAREVDMSCFAPEA